MEASGHAALYITGAGISMSALGAPDVAALSFGEILDRIRETSGMKTDLEQLARLSAEAAELEA
ncbi:MAG: hypothetical protein LCH90_23530 [Proteobacteria bacterium]|nr:hypothetical protein [Pseudomonadota bacterium]